jgi:hypothetical protein
MLLQVSVSIVDSKGPYVKGIIPRMMLLGNVDL